MNRAVLSAMLETNGGVTLNTNLSGFSPTEGYSVAFSKEYEKVFDKVNDVLINYIKLYADKAAAINNRSPMLRADVKVGLWVDNGKIYLDLCEYVPELGKAKFLGKKRKQLAIFDFATKQSIFL